MYDFLKDLSETSDWNFVYGRSDFQNLDDAERDEVKLHLFLDPVKIRKKRNDQNEIESRTFSGTFMMLYSSSIDELTYEERYKEYIKPIIEGRIDEIEENLTCEHEVKFEEWVSDEIINVFDYNLDGIIVTYKITYDE